MAYTKTTWIPDETVVSAALLNHMEDGIAANDAAVTDAVMFSEQELTDDQQAQARSNIGAAAQSDMTTAQTALASLQTAVPNLASVIENTASGAVASFTDGAAAPIKQLTAQVKAAQSFNGYDHPWAPGGGRNLLENNFPSRSTQNYTLARNNDGTFTLNATLTASTVVIFNFSLDNASSPQNDLKKHLLNGTYFLTTNNTRGSISMQVCASNSESSTSDIQILFGNKAGTVTIDDTYKYNWVRIVVGAGTYTNEVIAPVVCLSTETDTSYAPYSNICPITGWTGAEIWDDPKYGGLIEWNQLVKNGNFANGTRDWAGSGATISASDGVLTVTKNENTSAGVGYARQTFTMTVGHKYIFACDYKGIAGKQLTLFTNAGGAGMTPVIPTDSNWHTAMKCVNVIASPTVPCILWLNYATTTGDNVAQFRNVFYVDLTQAFGSTVADYIYSLEQANAGAGVAYFRELFPKDYYDYNAGQSMSVSQVNGDPYRYYSITFPAGAGTVYGGTLTIHEDGSGTLISTHALLTMDGSTIGRKFGSKSGSANYDEYYLSVADGYTFGISGSYVPQADANANGLICSVSPYYDFTSAYRITFTAYISASYGLQLRIRFALGIGYDTLDAANQFLADLYAAGTPVEFCYPLKEATTYELTAEQVSTILGENHVWADTGNVSLTYRADTKLYIDARISEALAQGAN